MEETAIRIRSTTQRFIASRAERRGTVLCGFLFLFLLLGPTNTRLRAQEADKVSRVQTLYIDSFGSNHRAEEMRTYLIRRLEHGHQFHIVTDRARADATLKGTAQIWSTGQVSLSPRSHSADAPILEGYLSVELVGKNRQTLWSYLATPGKFPWEGISENLARQVALRLTEDLRKDGQPVPADAASTMTPGAQLKGAGGTFPGPLYKKWFQSFEELHPEAQISYDPVGSGEGIRRASQGEVDFGASDMPLTESALAQAHHRLVQIPTVLGAVVPIYHVAGLRREINFTPEILSGIYLGKIRKWNDAHIRDANPQAAVPDADIVVVHRSDASGTSFVWSDYLSKVSAEWKSAIGAGVNVPWPLGIGAAYNEGVAAAVQETPNSIGYVELIYAIQHELSFGRVRNAAGVLVRADLASVTEAARTATISDPGFQLSITDAPGKAAYPIASYTWLLLPEQFADKNKRATLLGLVRWTLTSGQKSCSALGYAPLPADVARHAMQTAEQILQP